MGREDGEKASKQLVNHRFKIYRKKRSYGIILNCLLEQIFQSKAKHVLLSQLLELSPCPAV